MLTTIVEKLRQQQSRFSFGSTSAIITSLALMTGLDAEPNAKISIIGGILVIALADNIADSFGVHLFYQESERIAPREIIFSTIFNFIVRIIVSLIFVLLIWLLPLRIAILSSIVWGFALLSLTSYMAAKSRGGRPLLSILLHLLIASVVIFLSQLVGDLLIGRFGI